MLVDTNPHNNRAARMAGLPVVHAHIGSEFVREEIDLGGIGRLLAMTSNDEVNALAALEFTPTFGSAEVYQVPPEEASSDRTERVTANRRGRTLFDNSLTIGQLEKRFSAGAIIKKTLLTDDFTWDSFLARYGDTAVALFRVEGAQGNPERLTVVTPDLEQAPKAGQKLIALVDEA